MAQKRTDLAFKDTGKAEPWLKKGGQFELQIWQLEPPTKTFWADVAIAKSVFDVPTLFFAQLHDEETPPHTYYAVTLPPDQFGKVVDSFSEIEASLKARFPNGGNRDFSKIDFARVPDGRKMKHGATVIRAAANDQHAMLDFYQVELITEEGMKARGIRLPPVMALARVWMAPALLFDLLRQMQRMRG